MYQYYRQQYLVINYFVQSNNLIFSKINFFYSNDETNGICERLSRISKQDYRKRIQEHAKLFLRERRETTRERDERLRDALLYEWRSYIYVLLLPMSILKNCWPLLLYTKHLTLYENPILTKKCQHQLKQLNAHLTAYHYSQWCGRLIEKSRQPTGKSLYTHCLLVVAIRKFRNLFPKNAIRLLLWAWWSVWVAITEHSWKKKRAFCCLQRPSFTVE